MSKERYHCSDRLTRRGFRAPWWFGRNHPIDDGKFGPFRLSFNPQLRIEFRGPTVISDAGLFLPCNLDERLGLGALIERQLPALLVQRRDGE